MISSLPLVLIVAPNNALLLVMAETVVADIVGAITFDVVPVVVGADAVK